MASCAWTAKIGTMADAWIRCHACAVRPDGKSNQLLLLNCRHLSCQLCADKAREPSNSAREGYVATCPVCSAKPVRTIDLSRTAKLPSQITALFSNQTKAANQSREIRVFQAGQMTSLTKRMTALAVREREAASAKIRDDQARCGQLRKLLEEASAETAALEAAIKQAKKGRRKRSKAGSSSGGSARGINPQALYLESDSNTSMVGGGDGGLAFHQGLQTTKLAANDFFTNPPAGKVSGPPRLNLIQQVNAMAMAGGRMKPGERHGDYRLESVRSPPWMTMRNNQGRSIFN